ncbi:hypothetical protein [Bradyrhizobium sp. 170]|uniref:hypothetical protein n=1 Tax=Bradyrhizobium sp. 170 TaxID=2782641 RepID=UPI0020003F3A|nr:hypothetical protein [Bradyrhizobium sp. 170]UPK05782.1 hypothetical protein IVB05_09475 [Bradyrhizobium sp. 170]
MSIDKVLDLAEAGEIVLVDGRGEDLTTAFIDELIVSYALGAGATARDFRLIRSSDVHEQLTSGCAPWPSCIAVLTRTTW